MTASTHHEPRGPLAAPFGPLVDVRPPRARAAFPARAGDSRSARVDLGPAFLITGVGLLLGLLLALGGVAWGWVTVGSFQRVAAGTTQSVTLDQKGYVVYAEGGIRLDPAEVEIRAAGQGVPLAVRPVTTAQPVSLLGLTEVPVGEVSIPVGGSYVVSAAGPQGLPVTIALGDHDPRSRVLLGLGVGLLVVLVAAAAGVGRTVGVRSAVGC